MQRFAPTHKKPSNTVPGALVVIAAGDPPPAEAAGPPPPPPPPPPIEHERDADGVPVDFDWKAYITLYPDLEKAGVTSEAAAKKHFKKDGEREGRIWKRLRVVMRYTACTGLMNQHYSHIHAFALSAMLGAELVLPPGVRRSSFEDKTSLFKEQNVAKWMPVPMESLWDVEYIIKYWKEKGMRVHKVGTREDGTHHRSSG